MLPPLRLTANLKRRITPVPLASNARSAAGRRGRKTPGSARAGTNGTHLIQEESAPLAYNNGLRPNAYRAADGRRIRSGTPSEEL